MVQVFKKMEPMLKKTFFRPVTRTGKLLTGLPYPGLELSLQKLV
jgi:hypothetical protein